MRRVLLGFPILAALLTASAADEKANDKETPQLVLHAPGHTAPIRQVLFRPPDGKEVITVSEDKTVMVWDTDTGRRTRVFHPPIANNLFGQLFAAAVTHRGDLLAVGGRGFGGGEQRVSPIFLINLDTGGLQKTLSGQRENIESLAFAPNGKHLAAGGIHGKVEIWDVDAARVERTLEAKYDRVAGLSFSPDGKQLAAVGYDMHSDDKRPAAPPTNHALLWSLETGQESSFPTREGLRCVAWGPRGRLLATAGIGKNAFVHLWNADSHKPAKQEIANPWKGHTDVTSVQFRGPDHLMYTVAEFDAEADFQDALQLPTRQHGVFVTLSSGKHIDGPVLQGLGAAVCGDLAPGGDLAATAGGNANEILLWNPNDGKLVRRLRSGPPPPALVGWAPKGKTIGWAILDAEGRTPDRLQRSFNLVEQRPGVKLDAPRNTKEEAPYRRAQTTAGDLTLTRGKKPRTVVVSRKGKPVQELAMGVNLIRCFTFLGPHRAAVGAHYQLSLFDTDTGKCLHNYGGFSARVLALAPSPDDKYLLAAFADGTLRVYDLDHPQPLMSLYFGGADWVAWTPQGYYTASPAGERLVGWHVNHGLDAFGTVYPAAQFNKLLYRPDLVEQALDPAAAARVQRLADVAQSLPPEVTLTEPDRSSLPDVEIKASAQSKWHPILSLQLLLDGRPYPEAETKHFRAARAGEAQRTSWKVKVPPGTHQLSVRAESDVSTATAKELEVTYDAGAQDRGPKLYVLAVGIDKYPGSLRLEGAVNDANGIIKDFKELGKPPYGMVETRPLLDQQATRQGILDGLKWLSDKMTAEDTAVVFYAGHGHRDRKTHQFFLIPSNVNLDNLAQTAVSGAELKKELQGVKGKVLVLLDACHSGAIGGVRPDGAGLTEDLQRQLAAEDCGVVVMCAATSSEEAGENAAARHGYFTQALLEGLEGAAFPNKEGFIHLTGLHFYVETQVSERSKDEQHVVIDRPTTVSTLLLVKPKAKAKTP
jgi:WD40 repeat protein